MMKNIMKILKKYRISVYIALSIILIGIALLVLFNFISNKEIIKTYKNENYVLQYDKTWRPKTKEKNNIVLKRGNHAKIKIEIIPLKDEARYSSIDDLIEEIIYNTKKQNTKYKLLSKKDTVISKYEYKGYKLLYENDSSQVMNVVYKKSDKLIMMTYEADNEYFDILLDSAQNIIYSFDTKEKTYDLKNKIAVDTSEISYSSDKELDNKLGTSQTHEIANSNYYVKYSIPNNFELSSFDSRSNYFNLKGIDNKSIAISANIYKYNIFEVLDKENTFSIYKDYKKYKENKDYSDFEETLTKLDGTAYAYLYKNSYHYNKAVTYDKNMKKQEYKRKDENAKLIYALNKNHVLILDIKTTGTSITKKLLDHIKIEEIKNYSSYVTSIKKDNMLVSDLKRYAGYDKSKIDHVTIKMPDKYSEMQKYNNIYAEKIFGLNYDEDHDMYDYKIRYILTAPTLKKENMVESINSTFTKAYGECNYLTQSNDITLNNYKFNVYNGGYTQLGGIMFTNINRFKYYTKEKVLFYELTNGGYLVIEISANGKEITDEILKDATNFDVKEINNEKKKEETK